MNIIDLAQNILSYYNKGKTELDLDKDVILFLVDGLSIEQAKKIKKDFQTIETLNIPSTAPVITSLNLIKYPGDHGIYAWYSYSEIFKEVIAPVAYVSSLGPINTKKHLILEGFETIYQKIDAESYVFIPKEYSNSLYSQYVYYGAQRVGYLSLSEVIVSIRKITRKKGKKFIFIYYPKLDSLNHLYGPNSKQSIEEIKFLKYFINRLKKFKYNLIVTADHGFIELDTKKRIPIEVFKELDIEFVAGEQRNLFVKPKEDPNTIYEIFEKLKNELELDIVIEQLNKKAIKRLLGSYSDRVKHLIDSIFIQFKDNGFIDRGYNFLGDHGGASNIERKIPLIIY